MDKKAMYDIGYGLYVLTARDEEKVNGCIINTVTQITSEPQRITIAVNKANHTHDMILKTGLFNVSVLTEEVPFAIFQHFGFQSGKDIDKMEQLGIYEVIEEDFALCEYVCPSKIDIQDIISKGIATMIKEMA